MVQIKPVQKVNPQDLTAEKKFYAQAVTTGTVDLERLAYLVANQSTVREADCYAVILSLVHNIMDELQQGKIVKLDKLGSFQVGVKTSGVATQEEVSVHLIKKAHLNFRPDVRLREMLNNLKFRLVA
ncbi:HU family DNA-binding protein [Wenyingzhuangia sp. 2_MG-2023]|uniref:HU family DNA-binding protein n=1 Tax=Wenyingzhuangia sp. 2_MG-2023 TaxID=3062639 RepID=UPI0026E2684C|nr:HU family DNA-binding protein [Wenyingzhuangia sp. 2_MG-2023]MDO6739098.1 HU family DNA-binding protein [Wenyingzhuangia sp. 2_MG-2023]